MLNANLNPAEIENFQLSHEEQEKILQLQQAILESVAHGEDHMAVINNICQLEEQLLPNSVGSVMLMDGAYEYLNVYAAPSIPAQGISRLNGLKPGPGGGSCGNVIYRLEPQFVSNTFTDPRWQDLRNLAYDFNICSCWSVPIYSSVKKVIGTFALSSFEHRSPTTFHHRLLDIGASIIGIVLDRNKSEASVRLFEKVFEGSEEGIMITDPNKFILSVNNTFTKILGYTLEDLQGQTPKMLSSGQHDEHFYANMWKSINTFGLWRGEIWNRRKNGEIFPEWLSISAVYDQNGNLSHYIGILSDISDIKTAEEQIQFLSSHDALTGLPNLMLFKDRLDHTFKIANSNGRKVALLNIDIDNFQLINDSLGHTIADKLLCDLAKRLSQGITDTDTLCRHGGDEFLLALTNMADIESIRSSVDQIFEQISQPILLTQSPISLSSSIGIALYPDDGDNFDTLLKQANVAMQQAKKNGRNTYHYYTEKLNSNSLEFLHFSHGLRNAIKHEHFVLHYQPQYDLNSGTLIGAEALIRWQHPEEGLIFPGRFIDIAEKTGLIVEIGEWVLKEACRQAVAWQRAGYPPMVMAVNVSVLQLRRGNIKALIQNILRETGLAAEFLEIELTESILLDSIDQTLIMLKELKDLGIKLAIDDFGTGYSSLAYLKKFRIDKLKIDQSFVRDIANNPNDAAIILAIVQMAHALNLKVIAEGVENEEMLTHLLSCHCDEAQGYHFAKPMTAEAFAQMLDH